MNVGSSSAKLSVLDDHRPCAGCDLLGASIKPDVLISAARELGPVDAVGHRIVHGGECYVEATRVNDRLLSELRDLAVLAPLHQARSLDALVTVTRARPRTLGPAALRIS